MHHWGEKDFDWNGLTKSMSMIYCLSRYIGLRPIMKEKYGTIRYEFTFMWGWKKGWIWLQSRLFRQIVKLTVLRFPHLKDEIVEDYNCCFKLRIT